MFASDFEGVSSFEEASGSELAYSTGANEATAFGSGSLGATHQEVPARHASSDDDHRSESALDSNIMSQHHLLISKIDAASMFCIISTGTQIY